VCARGRTLISGAVLHIRTSLPDPLQASPDELQCNLIDHKMATS